MAASSSLSATVVLLPLTSHAAVSRKSPFLSFLCPPSSSSISMGCRTPSLSHGATALGSEQTVDAKEIGEEPAVSTLFLETEVDADKVEVSSVYQEKVVITNTYGENLVGILHEAGSQELVILCHGFRSSKESKTLLNLADALVSENISVFRFDFAGNGDSDGSFQYGNYWREVDDLRAVIQYFSGLKRKVHAIVGHSKGGNVVLLYASKFHDISTVINISGRFDLKRGIEDRLGKDFMERIKKDGCIDVMDNVGRFIYRVNEESLIDRLSTDMRAACLLIEKDCRVLTVHGTDDDIVPPEDAFEFDKLIANHKLHMIEGADHRFTSHKSYLGGILMDFIR